MRPLRIEIPEGGVIPRGYGVAWPVMNRAVIVCLPLGLNVLAAWGRRVLLWLRQPTVLRAYERDLELAWQRGQEAGFREARYDAERAYRAGLEAGRAEGRRAGLDDLLAPVDQERDARGVS